MVPSYEAIRFAGERILASPCSLAKELKGFRSRIQQQSRSRDRLQLVPTGTWGCSQVAHGNVAGLLRKHGHGLSAN